VQEAAEGADLATKGDLGDLRTELKAAVRSEIRESVSKPRSKQRKPIP
jgi:hypothetical protein